MAYIAKLARRLARLRERDSQAHGFMLCTILLTVACSAGEPTGPATDDPIDTGTAPDASGLVVSPRRVTIETSQQVHFRAFESALPGSNLVTSIEWAASGGSIGADGSYTSDGTGDFRVIGRRRGGTGGRADTAVVVVVRPQPSVVEVVVTPDHASLIGGGQQQFEVVGRLSDGSTAPIGVTWSAEGGTVDAGGLFSALNRTGTARVIAKHVTTGVADTVEVSVKGVQSLALTPSEATLSPGGTQQFAVSSRLSDGSNAAPPSVAFSATGGSISASGLYTAPSSPGTYTVTARLAAVGGDAPTATARVTVAAAAPSPSEPPPSQSPPASSAAYPNLPAGLTRIAEHSFDRVPGRGGDGIEASTGGSWSTSGNLTIGRDDSEPFGSQGYLRYVWPAGLRAGDGTGTGFDARFAPLKEIYVSYRVKIPTSTFENQSVGVKLLGYLSYGKTDRRNQFFLQMQGNGATHISGGPWSFRSDFTSEYAMSSTNGAQDYFQNKAGPQFRAGRWQQVELYIRLNDDGRENGVYRLWVNGVLVTETTRGSFVNSAKGATLGFYNVHFDPIWGGVGGTKSRPDELWIGHIYVAGVRQ